jgi:hypothetical protein
MTPNSHHRLLAVISVACAIGAGCASHGSSTSPNGVEGKCTSPSSSQSAFSFYQQSFAACSASGPTAEATHVMLFAHDGKPGLAHAHFDLHIRNPTPGHLWLLLNAHGTFPASTLRMSVLRNKIETSVYLWSFAGFAKLNGGEVSSDFEALYIAPNADVTLHGLSVEALGPTPKVNLRFVDTLYIGGRWAEEWLGHANTLGPTGDIKLDHDWEPVIQRVEEAPYCTETEMQVVCAQSFDVAAPTAVPAPAASSAPSAMPSASAH